LRLALALGLGLVSVTGFTQNFLM